MLSLPRITDNREYVRTGRLNEECSNDAPDFSRHLHKSSLIFVAVGDRLTGALKDRKVVPLHGLRRGSRCEGTR